MLVAVGAPSSLAVVARRRPRHHALRLRAQRRRERLHRGVARRALTGVLLVGGASTRFGSPKALAVGRRRDARGARVAAARRRVRRADRGRQARGRARAAVRRARRRHRRSRTDRRRRRGPARGAARRGGRCCPSTCRASRRPRCTSSPTRASMSRSRRAGRCRAPTGAARCRRSSGRSRAACFRSATRSRARRRDRRSRRVASPQREYSGRCSTSLTPPTTTSWAATPFRLAPAFADFAGIEAGRRVLDVGAGTGALTTELGRRGADAAAVDPSPPFVAALERRLPGVDVRAAPAEELPWPDESFDAALAQLVLTFMNDAPAGIAEMRRVVRPGGVVAACMWDRTGMDMLAAVQRTQQAVPGDGTTSEARTLYRTREEIETLFARDGFADAADGAARGRVGVLGLRRALGHAGGRRRPSRRLDQVARRRAPRRGARRAPAPGRRPGGRVQPARPCVGDARYARVRTLVRSAPVPTSVTSTSSSRSTKST